ncbi:MAG: IS21-like element helper ATPase IstB [Spirochaetia bacterium]|nr:IS21-like element helper ATPase IstB [Spirochaetia bacterium]
MKDINAQLSVMLKSLHLPGMRKSFDDISIRAQKEGLSHSEFLLELLERELEARKVNRTERLLRESSLPLHKNMNAFNLKRLPQSLSTHVRTILKGDFIKNKENILAFGKPGSGKTHLLCAIAQEQILNGYRVYFSPCSMIVQELLRAKTELRLEKLLKKYSRYDAIFIDDIGYVQQSREEMEVLFTLIADCYEKTSVMLTSNLPFSKWERIFKDPMTTAAAIDRLVHHSIILEINAPSYRMEKAKEKKTA